MKSATFEFYMEWAKMSITKTFEGKTWNEVGWELNAFQDIECLYRQVVEMGTADDMSALDALEAFASALQTGRLNKKSFENLKAALSIGRIRCLSLSDGKAPAPASDEGVEPRKRSSPKRKPAPRTASSRNADSKPRQTKAKSPAKKPPKK